MSVELAVDLVNSYALDPTFPTPELLENEADLGKLLARHGLAWSQPFTHHEVESARRVRTTLRRVFDETNAHDRTQVLASLVERAQVRLELVDDRLATEVTAPTDGFRDWLGTTAGLGLADFISEFGFDRLGICQASPCRDVYADATHNRSRRYCSDRCSNRVHSALHRRRLRIAKTGTNGPEARPDHDRT